MATRRAFPFSRNILAILLVLVAVPITVGAVQYVQTATQQHASGNTCSGLGGVCLSRTLCNANCGKCVGGFTDCGAGNPVCCDPKSPPKPVPTRCVQTGGTCMGNRTDCQAKGFCIPTAQKNLGCGTNNFCAYKTNNYNSLPGEIRNACSRGAFQHFQELNKSGTICSYNKSYPKNAQVHVTELCGKWYCDGLVQKQPSPTLVPRGPCPENLNNLPFVYGQCQAFQNPQNGTSCTLTKTPCTYGGGICPTQAPAKINLSYTCENKGTYCCASQNYLPK